MNTPSTALVRHTTANSQIMFTPGAISSRTPGARVYGGSNYPLSVRGMLISQDQHCGGLLGASIFWDWISDFSLRIGSLLIFNERRGSVAALKNKGYVASLASC